MREFIKKLAPTGMKNIYKLIRYHVISALIAAFSPLPIKKGRVALCNVWGYGDNPKWIAEGIIRHCRKMQRHKKPVRTQPELYFITNTARAVSVPRGIRLLRTNSIAALYMLATAQIWVDCNRKEPYIKKRKGQTYIQTWHGSLPLKRIEGDYASHLSAEYMENAKRDSAMADIFISNSDFFNDICRNSFFYKGRIECIGTAREDALLSPSKKRIDRLYRRYGIDRGMKLAVYAPTFRESGNLQEDERTASQKTDDGCGRAVSQKQNNRYDNLDYKRLIMVLEKRFGGAFTLIVRLHPIVAAASSVHYSSRVIDGNKYGDIYELLEAADVLITDYSNTLFECAFAKKPVFLYAPDYSEYERSRGFYFDYKRLPYPIAATEKELRSRILSYDAAYYSDKQEEMFINLGIKESGHASSDIAKMIIDLCETGKSSN